jgi:molybdate transport system ATP-binding protein
MLKISLKKQLTSQVSTVDIDVELVVDAQGFSTLYGTSGAGKTTVLRMLAGLTKPDQGTITMHGEVWFDSCTKTNLPPQKRSIGFVFQDFALFPNLTVIKNIMYGVGRQDAINNELWLKKLIKTCQIEEIENRLPDTLSGGQKQRVALARALARRPALLLLDEPLSALDGAIRSQLQEMLMQVHQECGLTTLLVSHDLGEVFKLSTQVHRIAHGKIQMSGTPNEVFLKQPLQGRLHLQAQILAMKKEEIIFVLSVLIDQQIIEIIVPQMECKELKIGDYISIATKTFSPLIVSNF